MLTNSTTKKTKNYCVKVKNLHEKFSFQREINKLHGEILVTTLPDSKYCHLIKIYDNLRGIQINERHKKPKPLTRIILETSRYV